MTFTMLKLIPSRLIIPRIHSHPIAIGRKAKRLSSSLPNESQRNRNTISPQAKPM